MNRYTAKMLFRSIWSSLGRYLAILSIVALGVGFFAGLKSAQPSMLSAVENYYDSAQMYDFQLLSTLGFTQEDVDAFSELEAVSRAEGAYFADAAADFGGDTEAWHFLSITGDVCTPQLTAGRMPEGPEECLGDDSVFRASDIGRAISISSENEEKTLDMFASRTFTITGLARSPRCLSRDPGSTSLLSGSLKGFIFIQPESFVSEAYHEILLRCDLPGALYSQDYSAAVSSAEPAIRELLSFRSRHRRISLIRELEDRLAEAQAEIDDGRKELEDGRRTADEELENALKELEAAEKKIKNGWAQVDYGRRQLEDGMAKIPGARAEIAEGRRQLDEKRAEIAAGREELEAGKAELEDGARQVELYRSMYDEAMRLLAQEESRLQEILQEMDLARYAALAPYYEAVAEHQAEVLVLQGMIDQAGPDANPEYVADLQSRLAAAQAALEQARAELASQESSYVPNDSAAVTAEDIIARLHERASELEAQLADAEKQLEDGRAAIAATEKQLDDGEAAIAEGEKKLNDAEAELNKAEQDYPGNVARLNDAAAELLRGQTELDEGRAEYEQAKADAEKELAEGLQKLDDAQQELNNSRKEALDALSLKIYCLDRSKNAGYVSFENDTSIVDAVSFAFPLFFVLIAALVCTTTMTRMVHEERTVIGTMKSLGYRSGAVMSKYLFYSGSSALLGCILGYFLGTKVIPHIVWRAYGMLYNFAPAEYYFDPLLYILCLAVSFPGILLVTWLTCRSELSAHPAELIRPKPPGSGKRIFLEYIKPLWNSLSFLGKVTLRNAFRYRQRFIMMLLGVSGCTALLVAGFGLRDSLSDIGSLQYDNVSLYDLTVSLDPEEFSSDLEAEKRWTEYAENCAMTYQENITLSSGDSEMKTHVVAADADTLPQLIDLHDASGAALPFPGRGEAVIAKKLASRLDLSPGDTAKISFEDGETLSLMIKGICENYIDHYVYVSRATLGSPRSNTALIRLREGADEDAVAASLRAVDGISYVSLASYERETVELSLSSLDLIIVLIVICSGALAFITLYNLTNINIMERSREVATVKVLGFTPYETAAYILLENLLLSVMGALLGLILGKFLHYFIMGLVDIDKMSYVVRIRPASYIWSFVTTIFFTIGTDLVMYRKLDGIDMAESLKSVE